MYTLSKIFMCSALLITASCQSKTVSNAAADKAPKENITKVEFNADSAYAFVERQVAFGPRVPGSQASADCADWLESKLVQYGASDVQSQRAKMRAYTGKMLDVRNISASFNPKAQKRVLLLAHWDSRPWADHDPDETKRDKPIDGANDGASGVGVILEIARNIAAEQPKVGVDVLFVDAEDYGVREDEDTADYQSDSWALGTQYWVQNPTIPLNTISYAILLDMVGGKDAVFPREFYSNNYARDINDRVWKIADKSGYSSRFVSDVSGPIIDDHIYLLKAGIPAIDIIEAANPATGSFNPAWHTHADNMSNIDKATLKAVGQTVQNLIYNE